LFSLPPLPPRSPLFPYTTLFRSFDELGRVAVDHRHLLRDRVIGRDGDEARAEDRVGPGGIDLDRLAIAEIEPELHALALADPVRSEEHTSELQSRENLVCRLLLE